MLATPLPTSNKVEAKLAYDPTLMEQKLRL
jgi:hypothetical protein